MTIGKGLNGELGTQLKESLVRLVGALVSHVDGRIGSPYLACPRSSNCLAACTTQWRCQVSARVSCTSELVLSV